jgi:hypothetical protein
MSCVSDDRLKTLKSSRGFRQKLIESIELLFKRNLQVSQSVARLPTRNRRKMSGFELVISLSLFFIFSSLIRKWIFLLLFRKVENERSPRIPAGLDHILAMSTQLRASFLHQQTAFRTSKRSVPWRCESSRSLHLSIYLSIYLSIDRSIYLSTVH